MQYHVTRVAKLLGLKRLRPMCQMSTGSFGHQSVEPETPRMTL
jgi:hypothetical protein